MEITIVIVVIGFLIVAAAGVWIHSHGIDKGVAAAAQAAAQADIQKLKDAATQQVAKL